MHSTLALAALAAVAYAAPQGVTEKIPPPSPAPAGCKASYDGKFQIAAIPLSKRDVEKRSACDSEGSLTLTLADGVLLDGLGRTGYIADNYQFQFDKPAQTGAIYTSGFSACANDTLALGGSAVWYRCLSGEFYNLYDRHWAEQCSPVTFDILPCSGGPAPPNGVTQIGDGQVQAPTGNPKPPVTQIGDGQIQAPTGNPKPPVTQIGDGQVQAPTGKPKPAPITQIGDGQIQAPTGVPAPKPAPITQIGDGQIQAPKGTPAPKPAPVTQIGDGQVQAPKGNSTAPSRPQYTGGAGAVGVGSAFGLLVVGVMSSLFL